MHDSPGHLDLPVTTVLKETENQTLSLSFYAPAVFRVNTAGGFEYSG